MPLPIIKPPVACSFLVHVQLLDDDGLLLCMGKWQWLDKSGLSLGRDGGVVCTVKTLKCGWLGDDRRRQPAQAYVLGTSCIHIPPHSY